MKLNKTSTPIGFKSYQGAGMTLLHPSVTAIFSNPRDSMTRLTEIDKIKLVIDSIKGDLKLIEQRKERLQRVINIYTKIKDPFYLLVDDTIGMLK